MINSWCCIFYKQQYKKEKEMHFEDINSRVKMKGIFTVKSLKTQNLKLELKIEKKKINQVRLTLKIIKKDEQ